MSKKLYKGDVAEADQLASVIAKYIKQRGCDPQVALAAIMFALIDHAIEYGETRQSFGSIVIAAYDAFLMQLEELAKDGQGN